MDKEKVKKCLSRAFGVSLESITDETSQENLPEWDSLRHLSMIVELELEFGVDFDPEEISIMKDIEKVYKCLETKF